MKLRSRTWAFVAAFAAAGAVPVHAADAPTVLADLTAVIALLGLPCGKVLSATRTNDQDHVAVCQDGNRYRVSINAEGRVVAQKQ